MQKSKCNCQYVKISTQREKIISVKLSVIHWVICGSNNLLYYYDLNNIILNQPLVVCSMELLVMFGANNMELLVMFGANNIIYEFVA